MTAGADPFAGMSDAAVLSCAADNLQRSAALRDQCVPYRAEWLKFRDAMDELERRQAAARWRSAMRLTPLNVTWRGVPAGSQAETTCKAGRVR